MVETAGVVLSRSNRTRQQRLAWPGLNRVTPFPLGGLRHVGPHPARSAAAIDRVGDGLYLAGVGKRGDGVGGIGLAQQLEPEMHVLPAEVLQVAVEQARDS